MSLVTTLTPKTLTMTNPLSPATISIILTRIGTAATIVTVLCIAAVAAIELLKEPDTVAADTTLSAPFGPSAVFFETRLDGYAQGRSDAQHDIKSSDADAREVADWLLSILWMAETDGDLDPPLGDGGAALGPFQIHRIYWEDAKAHDPTIPEYSRCSELVVGAQVVTAYMQRWAPDAWAAGDIETIARTHNGGPDGPSKASTDTYWARVQSYLP